MIARMRQAAAEGNVALQRCEACGAVQYPPREMCGSCLSDQLGWDIAATINGRLLAGTTLHHSNAPRFRSRLPMRIGLVLLDAGPVVVCFLGSDAQPDETVHLRARLDDTGHPVLEAT
ncbi:MAG: Zn-ribbon domain-containing OB-fold protein [Acetobacteraceae bacterium]